MVKVSAQPSEAYDQPAMTLHPIDHAAPQADFRAMALAQFDSMYRLAHHLTGNAVDADDVVQEAYLRALRAEERFELGSAGIRPWLFRILANVYRNRRRDNAVEQAVLANIHDEMVEQPSDTGASIVPFGEMNWEHVDGAIGQAVRSLPDGLRQCFLLFAMEDMKYREIAHVLEIPIGTVMSRLSRARRQLLKQLAVAQPAGLGATRNRGVQP